MQKNSNTRCWIYTFSGVQISKVKEAIKNYSRTFTQAVTESGGIPTINQIEAMWSKLDTETRNIFVKMVSGSINSLDESELISSKKENT